MLVDDWTRPPAKCADCSVAIPLSPLGRPLKRCPDCKKRHDAISARMRMRRYRSKQYAARESS